jgi:hypothetical protein
LPGIELALFRHAVPLLDGSDGAAAASYSIKTASNLASTNRHPGATGRPKLPARAVRYPVTGGTETAMPEKRGSGQAETPSVFLA